MSFGDFLRTVRKEAGFTRQVHLAKASKISQATISRLEDNVQKPTAETLATLSKVLKVSLDELMQAADYIKLSSGDSIKSDCEELEPEINLLLEENKRLKGIIKSIVEGW